MPHPKRRVLNKCVICNIDFEVQLSYKYRKITCSKECSSKNRSNKRIGIKEKKPALYNKCVRCDNLFLRNLGIKKPITAKYCSRKCQNDDHSERMSGENSPNWKGGITNTNSRDIYRREINLWRNLVFKRDKYTCQHCNSKKNLEGHHIIFWSKNIDTRFEVDNGLTLCKDCHGKVHNTNFGVRKKHYCIDCACEVLKTSKRCLNCYYMARKNKIIINRTKN